MKLWDRIRDKFHRPNTQESRMRRLERNDARVEDLHNRAERILNENHLGPAIRKALEGH